MDNIEHIWNQVKEQLYLEMIEVHYNTWIKPLIPIKIKGSNFYVYSVIKFVNKIVEDKYKDSIENKLRLILNTNINLVLIDPSNPLFAELTNDDSEENRTYAYSKPIDESENIINQKTPDAYIYKSNLNKKNTFDNFVKGKSNDLALAIAQNVAENPGTIYNPFFIYGSSGLGKTHLMQAVGHRILEKWPNKKVIYITSENFMNEFISTITDSKNSVSNSQIFRDKYRKCDVLMIDDIQFISGKESTQEEIFHTFNSLQQAKKQIIFTSDKRPEEIKGLEERLVTRFSGGMIADIQKPDFETRVAILQHKISMEKYTVPKNVISFIAENVTDNIRNLEGSILKVMALHNLKKKSISGSIDDDTFLEIAKQALSITQKKQKPITLDRIKEVVAKYYDLKPDDLIKHNRQKSISDPRQIAMHLSRQMTNLSLIKIADSFERDHATIIYGDDKVKNLIKKDEDVKKHVENIIAILKNN